MRKLILLHGHREVPDALVEHAKNAGLSPVVHDRMDADERPFAVMLMLPIWHHHAFMDTSGLWERHLAAQQPDVRLLAASYQNLQHPNHLDLLRLDTYPHDWWEHTLPVAAAPQLPAFEGVDVAEKLHRFFAGHGQDSVVAVMSRIRLVVQMASRELHKMHTPYAEIYEELVQPAHLEQKWQEWRNRWVNYFPYFENTPIVASLRKAADIASSIERWMLANGTQEEGLLDGSILDALDAMREALQQIEQQYVVQKLPHTHR